MNLREILTDIHALRRIFWPSSAHMVSARKPSMLHMLVAKNQKMRGGFWILGSGRVFTERGSPARLSTATKFSASDRSDGHTVRKSNGERGGRREMSFGLLPFSR